MININNKVRDKLWNAAIKLGVSISYNTQVTSFSKENEQFQIIDKDGNAFTSDRLIISSGGLSVHFLGLKR